MYRCLMSFFGSESSPPALVSSPTSHDHDVYRSTYSVDKTGTYRYDPKIPMYSNDISKKRALLIHENREYWPHVDPSEVNVGNRVHLECRRTAGCPGSMSCKKLNDDSVLGDYQKLKEHRHHCVPSLTDIINKRAEQQFIDVYKNDASICKIKFSEAFEMFTCSLKNLNDATYTKEKGYSLFAPNIPNFQRKVNRHRQQASDLEPTDVKDIQIPEHLKTFSVHGGAEPERLVWANERCERGSIILLSTERFLRSLFGALFILIDATFRSCPKLFYAVKGELLMYHTLNSNHQIITLAYFLVPGKSKKVYDHCHSILLRIASEFRIKISWESAITDFELALQKSLMSNFHKIRLKGCYFHFSQAIVRWLFEHGFKKEYLADETCTKGPREIIRMILSLGFLPPKDVSEGYYEVKEYAKDKFPEFFEKLSAKGFFRYFEKQWLRNKNCPIHVWNLYGVIGERTTSKVSFYLKLLSLFLLMSPSLNFIISVARVSLAYLTMVAGRLALFQVEALHATLAKMWDAHPGIFQFLRQVIGLIIRQLDRESHRIINGTEWVLLPTSTCLYVTRVIANKFVIGNLK